MAVSLDPRLALIQILKTTQQILCTLKMKEDQKKVHKTPKVKLFQETAVCIFISVGPSHAPFSACFETQLIAQSYATPLRHLCEIQNGELAKIQ